MLRKLRLNWRLVATVAIVAMILGTSIPAIASATAAPPAVSLPVEYAAPGDEVALDEFGDPIPAPEPELLINGLIVQPDNNGNYTISGGDDEIILMSSQNGAIDGSITLTTNSELQLASNFEMSGGSVNVLAGTFATSGYDFINPDGSILIGQHNSFITAKLVCGSSYIHVFEISRRGDNCSIIPGGSTIEATLILDSNDKKGTNYHDVILNDYPIYQTFPETTQLVDTGKVNVLGDPIYDTVIVPEHTDLVNTVYALLEGASKFHSLTVNGHMYIRQDIQVDELHNNGQILFSEVFSNKNKSSIPIDVTLGVDTYITK